MSAFSHRVRVRYNECDPQGIVFNANYVVYVDLTVGELWRRLFGSYQAFIDQTGVDIVVADLQLRFRASARFDDEIDIALDPTLTSSSSITTAFRISRDDTLLVEGSVRHVCVDARDLAKTPAPELLREAIGAQGAGG